MRWRKMLSRDDMRKAEAYQKIRRSLPNGTRGQQIVPDRPDQLRISGLTQISADFFGRATGGIFRSTLELLYPVAQRFDWMA